MAKPYRKRAVLSACRVYSHDPLEHIDSISGINSDHTHWMLSQAAAIAAIEAGSDEFFINESDGRKVKLVVLTHRDQKYLRTE